MASRFNSRRNSRYAFISWAGLCAIAAVIAGLLISSAVWAQDESQPSQEIVADLAAGRLVIAVLKDAIFIGAIENRIEPETRPPSIVQLGDRRAGILLGAIRWSSPAAKVELARLDRDLPGIHSHSTMAPNAPHLNGGGEGGKEATDIEDVGNGVREKLDDIAKTIHGQIDIGDQPLAELVLADYVIGYGPEVWDLQYPLQQTLERGDYWDTRVLPPQYSQAWPPDKSAPHTLMEFQYPVDKNSPSLHDLLRRGDPRLQPVTSGGENVMVANQFLEGDTRKILAADAIPFLRSCLAALTPSGAREEIAVIGMTTGFQWIIPPPPEPKPPAAAVQNANGPQPARPPGAPTLLGPPHQ